MRIPAFVAWAKPAFVPDSSNSTPRERGANELDRSVAGVVVDDDHVQEAGRVRLERFEAPTEQLAAPIGDDDDVDAQAAHHRRESRRVA